MKLKIELEIMFKNNTSPRGNNVWGRENFKGCDHGKCYSVTRKFFYTPQCFSPPEIDVLVKKSISSHFINAHIKEF